MSKFKFLKTKKVDNLSKLKKNVIKMIYSKIINATKCYWPWYKILVLNKRRKEKKNQEENFSKKIFTKVSFRGVQAIIKCRLEVWELKKIIIKLDTISKMLDRYHTSVSVENESDTLT